MTIKMTEDHNRMTRRNSSKDNNNRDNHSMMMMTINKARSWLKLRDYREKLMKRQPTRRKKKKIRKVVV